MNQSKLQDLYVLYSLCKDDKGFKSSIKELMKFTNITRQTILKYLTIQENLDIRLFPYLDNKNKKLSLESAHELCVKFPNPDTQYEVFMNHMKKKNAENKSIISDIRVCEICCDDTGYIKCLPCCSNFICEKCFTKTIQTFLEDIHFNTPTCLFCRYLFDLDFIEDYLCNRFKYNYDIKWIDSNFKQYLGYINNKTSNYNYNILRRYINVYKKIKAEKRLMNTPIRSYTMLPTIIDKEIYGYCHTCTPITDEISLEFVYRNIKIKSIEKTCVTSENQILVIKPEMFTCDECKKHEIDKVKKCPHCGVPCIKPENCNFIGSCNNCRNSWCFVCSSRLPNNNLGHNHHYWTGRGSSPYDSKCRVTENSNEPTHVLEKCKCRYCRKRDFKPICLHEDCKKSAIGWKEQYCLEHYSA